MENPFESLEILRPFVSLINAKRQKTIKCNSTYENGANLLYYIGHSHRFNTVSPCVIKCSLFNKHVRVYCKIDLTLNAIFL